jgi:multicomponent Na+:H+ antiporter subunit E
MKTFVANLVLAVLWIGFTAQLTAANFLFGYALGYAILLATGRRRTTVYFRKVPEVLAFAGFFLKELVVSAARVAHDVITPTPHMSPAILGVPLDVTSDAEITLLACLITLTPGTLTLEISPDRKILYVHAMYVHNYDETRAAIKNGFERRILRLFR